MSPAIPKQLSAQSFDQLRNRSPIIDIAWSQATSQQITAIIDSQVQLEAKEPAHARLATPGIGRKDPVPIDPFGITDFQGGGIDKTDPSAGSYAHDRVCSCSPTATATHGSFLRVRSARGRLHMESGSLLGPRFHAPTRRDAPVSSQPGAAGSRAAAGNRWQPPRGLWSQHQQLSFLPAARAMPVEWQRNAQATPGERTPASSRRWPHAALLAGWEPQRVPACVSAPRARPARRGSPHHPSGFSFPCAADTQPPLVGDTPGSQCTIRSVWPSPHQTVWRSAGFCSLARSSFVNDLFRRPLPVGRYRADPHHEQASLCKQATRPLA